MDHRSNQQQQVTSGLTRYRSAPSSYFSSLLSSNNPANAAGGGGNCSYARDDFDQLLDSHVSSNDIKQVFDRFVANIGPQESDSDALIGNPRQIQQNSTSNMNAVAPMKQETDRITSVKQEMQQINEYNLASQMNYQTQAQQQNDDSTEFASGMDNFYRLLGTVDSNRSSEMKIDGLVGAGCSNSNLTRYNSSPAGLFAQVNIDNEYSAMRGRGASFSNPSRFSNQRAHTSGPGERSFGEGDKNDEDFLTGLSVPTWDDSQISTDDFLQIPEDNETEPFSNLNALDNQNSEGRARPPTLSTQMSLPQTTSELSAMEKLLQDSVPFKVRAKRGCATHPRSIAERVRRTRISERMRKLQDLVPNMDKQTNTADMLDFAADYIKELETQVKVLSERRVKCTCSEEIEGDIQSFKV